MDFSCMAQSIKNEQMLALWLQDRDIEDCLSQVIVTLVFVF